MKKKCWVLWDNKQKDYATSMDMSIPMYDDEGNARGLAHLWNSFPKANSRRYTVKEITIIIKK